MQKKLSPNDSKRQLVFCLFLLFVSFWFLLQTDIDSHTTFFIPKYVPTEDNSGFVVRSEICSIPDLDPYDPSIRKFLINEEEPLVCDKNNTGFLVDSNLTHLYINWDVANKFNGNKKDDVYCCYRPFWRIEIDRDYSSSHDFHRYANFCVAFKDPVQVDEENVRVECNTNDKKELIYKDFFSFIPKKLIDEASDFSPDHNLSILIIGIDGLSRLNFHRQMPKTYQFLVQKTNTVEYYGYNKVGDNTFPNLIPVLTGLSEQELINNCWASSDAVFDNCSFIWQDFKETSYLTGFGEDSSWMGLFQYQKRGFKKSPTDYYLRTFNKVCEEEIGHEKRLNADLCLGSRLSVDVILDVIKKFTLSLIKKRYFGFFWENSLSHDYLNLPRYGDEGHYQLFDRFLEAGVFDQSIIIVMSDHGMRWGGIRNTWQGFMEERLPLLMIAYPSWFSERFPTAVANLKRNQQYLTTPFDLHETLKDLINLHAIGDRILESRTKLLESDSRGISLFLPLPKYRSCSDAGIEDHWCTCHQSEEVSKNESVVKNAVGFVKDYMNSLLSGYKQCSKLKIKHILRARKQALPKKTENQSEDPKSAILDYVLRFQTDPGDGIFEATVRQHQYKKGTFNILGAVTRSNSYGNQSKCISHYKLKLYCYCIS